MGNLEVLIATILTLLLLLISMSLLQWIILRRASQYWFILPSLWIVFILMNSLFSFFSQSHTKAGIGYYLGFFGSILLFTIPAMLMVALRYSPIKNTSITNVLSQIKPKEKPGLPHKSYDDIDENKETES